MLPLGFDTFAVSAAVGALSPSRPARLRISALFVLFEVGMPLIGVLAGAPIAHVAGTWSTLAAAMLLVALGAWIVLRKEGEEEEERAGRLLSAGPIATIGLGVSISLDELAIGFSLGLSRLPVLAVLVAIGVQTVVASQLGLALGKVIGERVRERAERVAGLALIALGVFLVVERFG